MILAAVSRFGLLHATLSKRGKTYNGDTLATDDKPIEMSQLIVHKTLLFLLTDSILRDESLSTRAGW